MRFRPFDKSRDHCGNCQAFEPLTIAGQPKKLNGQQVGRCRIRLHANFINVPQMNERGEMVGMAAVMHSGFGEILEKEWCLEHVPYADA